MNSSIVLRANVVKSQFCTYLSRQISTNAKYSPLVLNSSSLCSSIIFQEKNINDGITRKLHIPIKQQYKMISTNLNSPILKDKPPITTTYNPTASGLNQVNLSSRNFWHILLNVIKLEKFMIFPKYVRNFVKINWLDFPLQKNLLRKKVKVE